MRVTANGPKDQTDWQCVDWRTANRQVRNLRQRIFRASRQGDWKRVHSCKSSCYGVTRIGCLPYGG
jgi:RNA-directed DNA polymerase